MIFSWDLAPKPGSATRRFSWQAYSSSPKLVMCSSSNSTRAFLGPNPGTRSSSRSPGGVLSLSSRYRDASPRLSSSAITPARDLPMPLTRASSPERRAASRSPGKVSTARAPASKALTLKGFSPASSKRSAISSRTAATSFLSIAISFQQSAISKKPGFIQIGSLTLELLC